MGNNSSVEDFHESVEREDGDGKTSSVEDFHESVEREDVDGKTSSVEDFHESVEREDGDGKTSSVEDFHEFVEREDSDGKTSDCDYDSEESEEENEEQKRWDETINTWIDIYKIHRPKLLQNIEELMKIAQEMRKTSWDVAVAQTTGSSVGLAAGALGLVGIILTPFTFGASLIVAGVGTGVGVAGAATHIGAGITKAAMFNNRIDRAKMIIEEINQSLADINKAQEALKELLTLFHAGENVCRLEASSDSFQKEKVLHIDSSQIGKLTQLQKFISQLTTKAVPEVVDVATETGAVAAKSSTKLASLASRVVGSVVIVVAMGLDIADIISNAKILKKSYQPQAVKQISESVEKFINYLKDIDDMYEKLRSQ